MDKGPSGRQTQILKAIVDEYIETTEPVGSEPLEKKYNLGVSPATIRNEMAALTRLGYLKQSHTSSGRIPTPNGMKFYINSLMEEKALSLADEVRAKEEVEKTSGDIHEVLEEATHALADATKNLSFSATDDGRSWYAGAANIFSSPALCDFGTCSSLFSFLEETERIRRLFFEREVPPSPIEVLFGEETGLPDLDPIGIVASRFESPKGNGAFGVIGPVGLRYDFVIPTLRYFKGLVEEALK